MNPHDEMDITAYLQTEGRRLAAELAAAASTKVPQPQPLPTEPKPLQADADAGLESPKSLGEVLQGMGVIRKPATRDLKPSTPGQYRDSRGRHPQC